MRTKWEIIREYAHRNNIPVIDIPVVQNNWEDMEGLPVMNKEITPNYIHSLDAAIINRTIEFRKVHEMSYGKHYCKECGKNDGHYIGCKESHN